MGKTKLYTYYMIVPGLILYLLFYMFPTISGIYFSFTDWRPENEIIKFTGIENLRYIFTDSLLVSALKNTFIFAVITILGKNILGLLLATGLNVKIKSRNILRTIYYIPAVLSTVVIGVLFSAILTPEGVFNTFLNSIGMGFAALDWLADLDLVIYTVSFVAVWQMVGYHMTIFLSGYQSIPTELYEAATIDGAGSISKFINISLPMLVPAINVSLLMSMISGLNAFSNVYTLTGGGPADASQVIGTVVFKKFGEGSWGLGTALNFLQCFLVALICIPLLFYLRKKEVDV
ncbi:raffinose/stachyose/melibiose transport system permease protein [Anaerobacterium chartisolvens]|uniref:Raffinose/stachyose/melibiose transport system permease protein n=1 Tax=Anaerobacterium chartisolvens TaxID=1297424 RepID=A0A369AUD3_9FIRM|nr:sugar ABC transporter permease [Anaerobacterium chartisolvens]RCX12992.1 raffinose/stachyose/melibiose transport system permease protein [Anaerobacterium chartisolvens]